MFDFSLITLCNLFMIVVRTRWPNGITLRYRYATICWKIELWRI